MFIKYVMFFKQVLEAIINFKTNKDNLPLKYANKFKRQEQFLCEIY